MSHLQKESVLYQVEAKLDSEDTIDAWARWMVDEHLNEVLAAGASSALLSRLDDDRLTFLAQYVFADRAAFDRYLANHAPRLRAAGIERFPPGRVTYSRLAAEVLAHHP